MSKNFRLGLCAISFGAVALALSIGGVGADEAAAVAPENAGEYLARAGDCVKALSFFARSHRCFTQFHVPQIRQKHASTMKLCRTRHIGTET